MKLLWNFSKRVVLSLSVAAAALISSNADAANCTPGPQGLVSWWRAEGNGLDSVGGNTAYSALLQGGVSFSAGEAGLGFLLNNTNAYLVVPASQSLNIGAGSNLTVEAWIRVSNVTGYHPIMEWHDSGRNPGVNFWIIPTGAIYADVKGIDGSAHPFMSANNVLTPNVFQHVALTYNGTTGIGTLYLNGAIVAQANLGNFVPQTTYNVWLGHRPGDVPGDVTYGTYLGGVLDELSLYNRALVSNEIAAIYTAGAAGKCTGTAPVITKQPTNQTAVAGVNATFTVIATGSPTLYYQWYGPASALIPGATASSLTLSNVQPNAAGSYFVRVTNQIGFVLSSNALLNVTGGGSNSNQPPLSGLVAWWKAESNMLDSVGSNNGVAVGGPISYAPGEVGNAFHYDNSPGYVSIPAAPSLDVGQGAGLTLEAWIQPADLQNEIPIFEWQYNTNTSANGIHFWVSSINGPGCLFANIVDSSFVSHWIYSAPGIVTADYQHVALTYDKASGVASIYRNGVLVASQNLGSFTPNTTGNLLLGERTYLQGQPQFHYLGNLDEMSVFGRALSQSEIASIYNAGSTGKGGSSSGGNGLIVPNYAISNQIVTADGTLNQPLREQMVYGASQFPTNPIVITQLRWRPDAIVDGPLAVTISNLQIRLSTATANPDHLSTVFAQNTGPDNTVVFNGVASVSTAFTTLSNGTTAFDLSLTLQTPFLYDPSKGNLLVDILNLSGSTPPRTPQYNIANGTGANDAVSRVFSVDPNATNAETADTGGDVLQIIYTNAPIGGGSNTCTAAPSGLVSWWKGETNLLDSVGVNNGALGGGVITYSPGVVGQSFNFDGSSFIQVPDSSSLHFTNTMSVEAWINLATINGSYHEIVSKFASYETAQNVFTFTVEPAGHLRFNIVSTNYSSSQVVSSSNLIPTNQWVHVAAVVDGTNVNLYVNGQLAGSGPWNQGIFVGNQPLTIGCTMQASPLSFFQGQIDELSLYSRALSQSEIAAIYNAGANGKCPPLQIQQNSVINPQPVVNMTQSGKSYLLSWPVSAGDFVLQSTDNLTPPVTWTNVPVALQTNGDNIEVTLPSGGQSGYFRLYHP